jgi:hypothetical protein
MGGLSRGWSGSGLESDLNNRVTCRLKSAGRERIGDFGSRRGLSKSFKFECLRMPGSRGELKLHDKGERGRVTRIGESAIKVRVTFISLFARMIDVAKKYVVSSMVDWVEWSAKLVRGAVEAYGLAAGKPGGVGLGGGGDAV